MPIITLTALKLKIRQDPITYLVIDKAKFSTSNPSLMDNDNKRVKLEKMQAEQEILKDQAKEMSEITDQSRENLHDSNAEANETFNNLEEIQEDYINDLPSPVRKEVFDHLDNTATVLEGLDEDSNACLEEGANDNFTNTIEEIFNQVNTEIITKKDEHLEFVHERIMQITSANTDEEYCKAKEEKDKAVELFNIATKEHNENLLKEIEIEDKFMKVTDEIEKLESDLSNELENKPEGSGITRPVKEGSLIDDYADVSTEPTDYTGGDD